MKIENKQNVKWLALLALTIGMTAANAAKGPGLNVEDQKVADVLMTASLLEAEGGKNASLKTVHPEVKDFAKTMVVEHNKAKSEMRHFLMKVGARPMKADQSVALKQQAKEDEKKLRKLTNSDFDIAYADMAISMHQRVLDTIDQELMPKTTNADLKAMVESNRKAVADHLAHAKRLRASMPKNKI